MALVRVNRSTLRAHSPESVSRGADYVLEHHADRLQADRTFCADHLSVAGINHAKAGRHATARKGLWRAARLPPDRRRLARALLATSDTG